MYSEADLKSKTVKDLKDIAKELGAPVKASAKKDELIAALLAHVAGGGAAGDAAAGVGEADLAAGGAAAAAAAVAAAGGGDDGSGAAAAGGGAGSGKAIVFALESKKSEEPAAHKANIQGIKVLSDAERAALRATKFGITPQVGGTKAGGAAPKGPVNKVAELEEGIKKLQRAAKYGTASEADSKKLESLQRQLEAEQAKQRMALDKVELMDPERMAAREKKFGRPLLTGAGSGSGKPKDLKDPEALRRRAEKFGRKGEGAAGAGAGAGGGAEDEARKKARLERFAQPAAQ